VDSSELPISLENSLLGYIFLTQKVDRCKFAIKFEFSTQFEMWDYGEEYNERNQHVALRRKMKTAVNISK
jgi:hypothetical protein